MKIFIAFLFYFLGISVSIAENTEMKILDEISGESLSIVNSALIEFQKRDLSLKGRKITVIEMEEHYIVLFEDANRSLTNLGSSANFPELNVIIDKETLKVLRSEFAR